MRIGRTTEARKIALRTIAAWYIAEVTRYVLVPQRREQAPVEAAGQETIASTPVQSRPLEFNIVPIAHKSAHTTSGTASDQVYEPADPTNRAVFREYLAAAGWRVNVAKAELRNAQLDPEDLAQLLLGNKVAWARGADRRIYIADPDRPRAIASYDPAILPTAPGWDAARLGPNATFETHFHKVRQHPWLVWHQLIQLPALRVLHANFSRDAAEKQRTLQPDNPQFQRALDDAIAEELQATRSKDACEKLFYLMRNKVFRTDQAEQQRGKALEEEGFDTADFHKRAKSMSTPKEIGELEKLIRARVPAQVV